MKAACEPRTEVLEQRLLAIDAAHETLRDHRIGDLVDLGHAGDVWVLNDTATLPASLAARAAGRNVELRLNTERGSGRWQAVLFGEGSWRDDTDRREAPPQLSVGDVIELGAGLRARVASVDERSSRLLEIDFEPAGDAFWRALYRLGRPVQYSYLSREMELDELSSRFGARPWSVEMPSAGRPLTIGLLHELRARGAELVTLTHAAGLSATGDRTLDALLPLPERYDIPDATAHAVARALGDGRRIVAVGTSTTRALEGSVAAYGEVRAGEHETDLRIGSALERRVVDALLTGAHDPSSSHYDLLRAFASDDLLQRAVTFSSEHGYLAHELGDSWLLVAPRTH